MAAKISLVLVISLVVALPWQRAEAQDDPWKSLADQAASEGISQQSIDEAQADLRGAAADSESSIWADWIKGNANNMGYTDENAPSSSADGGSALDEADAEDFADIGVDDSSVADAESPAGASPTYSPTYAPESQPPVAKEPTGADTPDSFAPDAEEPAAGTPEAYSPSAATPKAETPWAAAPDAQRPEGNAPDAETPKAEETEANAPTSEDDE